MVHYLPPLVILITISLPIFILLSARAIRNASLECNKCHHLIPAPLNRLCPNCGFDNNVYTNKD